VPTAEARITRQMLYSATPPAATFARLAMLPPDDATWNQVCPGNKAAMAACRHTPVGIDSFLVNPPCGPAMFP
jgi:hypothetical protein